MLVVRATKKLLDRLGPVTLESGQTSTTRLGVRHGLPIGVQIPARYGSVVSAFSPPRPADGEPRRGR